MNLLHGTLRQYVQTKYKFHIKDATLIILLSVLGIIRIILYAQLQHVRQDLTTFSLYIMTCFHAMMENIVFGVDLYVTVRPNVRMSQGRKY